MNEFCNIKHSDSMTIAWGIAFVSVGTTAKHPWPQALPQLVHWGSPSHDVEKVSVSYTATTVRDWCCLLSTVDVVEIVEDLTRESSASYAKALSWAHFRLNQFVLTCLRCLQLFCAKRTVQIYFQEVDIQSMTTSTKLKCSFHSSTNQCITHPL
jgi:hypothetical protein